MQTPARIITGTATDAEVRTLGKELGINGSADFIRSYVADSYAMNQKLMKDSDISSVTLYRGVRHEQADSIKAALNSGQKDIPIGMGELTSFTTDPDVARGFGDVVLTVKVSRERIFRSHVYSESMNESLLGKMDEVVVLVPEKKLTLKANSIKVHKADEPKSDAETEINIDDDENRDWLRRKVLEARKKNQETKMLKSYELLCQVGCPNEWSGSVAAALGADKRKELNDLWAELPEYKRTAAMNQFHGEVRVAQAKADKTTTIQTFIFSRDKFADVGAAAKWVADHGFAETKEPDETESSFRFRQVAPENFASGSLRTIDITDGVKAVVGRTKKMVDGAVRKEYVVDIAKVDNGNRIVYGVVLDPYVVDSQDDNMSPRDVEHTAHDYMANYRTVGLQHATETDSVPVQSFLVPYPSREDYAAAMDGKPHRILMMPFGDGEVPSGAWILGTKINDDALWSSVQAGDLNAYSIGGYGVRRPMTQEEMPVVTAKIRMLI